MGDASLTTELGRVLVTGGSGFVGANLVAELLECRGLWLIAAPAIGFIRLASERGIGESPTS